MDAIAKQLNNPEWWFTVVVVGLIIGVVAAYAKDWLSALLSSISTRFGLYAQKRRSLRTKEIEFLSENATLLLIEYVRCMFVLAATIALFVGSYLMTAWSVLRDHFPEVDAISRITALDRLQALIIEPINPETRNLLTQIIFIVPALFLWNTFLNRYMLCESARRRVLRSET